MHNSIFNRMGRASFEGGTRSSRRRGLLATTALSAAGALMLVAAPDTARAQDISGGQHMIVDGDGVGVGSPSSTDASFVNDGNAYMGNADAAFLTIRNGGDVLTKDAAFLGLIEGSRAEVTVTGANSRWRINSELSAGEGGDVVITVADGGLFSSRDGYLAAYGWVTEVLVTGAGSRWINDRYTNVGQLGNSTVTVADGGALSTGITRIGYLAGSTGKAVITGDGSTWNTVANMDVGYYGSGELIVTNGGLVSASYFSIGWEAGSSGETTVTGAGSALNVRQNMNIGSSGAGVLNIQDEGVVNARVVGVSGYGSSGVINFGAAAGDAAVATGTLNATRIAFGSGDGTIVFNHTDDDLSLGADISGAGTILIQSGRTALTGNNTYTGSTLLQGGTLTLGSSTALGGSTLTTTGSVVDYADGVNIANPIVIDSDTTQFQVLTGSATQSGVISELNGPRPFEKIGDGELVLTADNGWTGQTTISGGTLTFDGGSLALAADIIIGENAGDGGGLIIRNGGTVSNFESYVGVNNGSAGEVEVTGAGSIWTIRDGLWLGYRGNGVLTIADGGVVSSGWGRFGYNVSFSGGDATATVTGAGSAWAIREELSIGDLRKGRLTVADGGAVSSVSLFVSTQADGLLTIKSGGTVSNEYSDIGYIGLFKGEVEVTGAGSVLTTTNRLYVGSSGIGALTIEDGGAVFSTNSSIGRYLGSRGAVTVTGAGSEWTSTRQLYVGYEGNGALTVADGGAISSGESWIGGLAGSEGQATVTGANSVWNMNDDLYVGLMGRGGLTIAGGGSVSNETGYIGTTTGVVGRVRVTDAGSVWTNDGPLYVGFAGDGGLTVEAGGVVSSRGGYIGAQANGIGSVSVTGPGSTWNNTNLTVVGAAGQGALTIADGGTASSVETVIGISDGTGTVSVSGDGSLFTVANRILVAQSGDALLNISDGGVVSSQYGLIAEDVGSTGRVLVTGMGSRWSSLSTIAVGRFGAGELTVSDGGEVSAVNVIVGSGANGTGVLNIGAAAGDAAVAAGLMNTPTIAFGTGSGTIVFNHTSDDYALNADISGVGTINLYAGHTILGGNNTYTGATNLYGGTLTLGSNTGLGGTSLTAMGGVVDYADGATVASSIVIDSNATQFQVLTGSATQSGVISELNSPRQFDKIGAGELVLTADNTWTGQTTITGGTLTFDGGSVGLVGDIIVGEDAGDAGALIIRNGGAVANENGFIALAAGSVGNVTVTGANSVWTTTDELAVGVQGQGTLDIVDGGLVSSAFGSIGSQAGSTGEVTVTGAGSVWDNTDDLLVGAGGAGDLTIADGGAVSNEVAFIGGGADAVGRVRVTGAGSAWTNASSIYVGFAGDGAISVEAGGAASSAGAYIGLDAGSLGSVSVTGPGSQWTNTRSMYVGALGQGALTIADGGTVSSEDAIIGNEAGSTGTVSVSGPDSLWANTYQIVVGERGDARLTISDGGAVSSQGGIIGGDVGSVGSVLVTGAASLWSNLALFGVGMMGAGELTVSDGGAISSVGGIVGYEPGSSGVVTVTGAGSVWANSNALFMGVGGDGRMTIADGGAATSTQVQLGVLDSLGALTVTGAGSIFDSSGQITVGAVSDGLVTLSQGGTARAAGVTLAAAAGSTGALNIGAAAGDAAQAAGILDTAGLTFGEGAGLLVFNHTAAAGGSGYVFGTDLVSDAAGDARIQHMAGFTRLTGASAGYQGALDVNGGVLSVDGVLGAGDVTASVSGGGVLTGAGVVGGDVDILSGGVLAGASGRTLTIGGDLTLRDGALVNVALGAPSASELFAVGGDLTLDGTLSVSDLGGFGAGVYGLFTYGGALTDNGLAIGGTPTGVAAGDLFVQTAAAGRVNLVSAAGVDLRFWDGAASADDGAIQGGAGSWGLTGRNWTGADGGVNGAYDNPAFAVFMGTGGTVSVNGGGIGVTGMQFAADGYRITGGGIALTEAETLVRVGDGTAAGAAMSATLASSLTGAGGLVKTDLGTLILTGTNSYTGGTEVRGGTLIGNAASIRGDLLNDGLTIFDQAAVGVFAGRISGAGSLVKDGVGALTLTGTNSYTGGLEVRAGTLIGNTGSIVGNVVNNAALVFDQASDGTFSGAIAGDGTLGKRGAGVLTLTAANVQDWSVDGGALSVGAAAFSGDVAIASGAEFRFAPVADTAWAGVLSGVGGFAKGGAATLTLTGNSSGFMGQTTVSGGALRVNGTLGGDVAVTGGSLGGTGSVLGTVNIGAGDLIGVQGQTLKLGGLILSATSGVNVSLGGASSASLFDVTGDLTLDGTLSVSDLGGFGAGVYGLFTYGGALTDNGLAIGSMPTGVTADDLFVQTAAAGRVNLINTAGVDLRFWDGAASPDDGASQGGTGSWGLTGRNWTGANGAVNGAYDNPAFAVFMGTGGTVSVDGAGIGVTGMQFAVDGYRITGGGIALIEAETIVRVGDGTAAGAAMTATLASSLTGAGGLVKTDLGTLILTGTNSYTGGTAVRGGTLIGNAASLIGDIDNDAVLMFDQTADAAFAGVITGDGETVKRGAGVLSLLGRNAMDWSVETGGLVAQASAFSGDVDIASGANFTLNAGTDAVFSGVLSGDGTFAKTGAGDLALTGNSSNFDGVTEIRDGLLLVNGALGGELRMFDGALLGGSGALGQLTAGAGAVISPGNSIGTLRVAGDVTFEKGSIYAVEVDPASSASDRIVAGGIATLNGGTVRHVGYAGDYRPTSTYTILTAQGGVIGAFDSIETDFAFLDANLDYETNAVLMTLERNAIPFPAVGETFNQRSTAVAVEATGSGASLYDAVVGQNADGARLAFDSLSGELHGSIRTAQSEAAQMLAGTLIDRMETARSLDETGAAFWAQATGSRTRLATDGNAASLTHGAAGLMVGADAGLGALRVGVSAGTSGHDYDSHSRGGSAEGDSFSLAAYGSGQWNALSLKAAVSGTWHEVETTRVAAFPGFVEVLSADYEVQTLHAFVEASRRVDMGPATTLEPFVNIARVRTESDAFTETGGDAALAVQGRVQAANLATVGLGLTRAFDQGDGRTAVLSSRLGWRHAWGDTTGDGRHAFAASPLTEPAFTVRGLPVAEDAVVAELGLDLDLRDRLSLSIDWSGQISKDINANALIARASWKF